MGDKTFNQVEIKLEMISYHLLFTSPPRSYLYIDKVLLPALLKISHLSSRRSIHTTISNRVLHRKRQHTWYTHKTHINSAKFVVEEKYVRWKKNKNNCQHYRTYAVKIQPCKRKEDKGKGSLVTGIIPLLWNIFLFINSLFFHNNVFFVK